MNVSVDAKIEGFIGDPKNFNGIVILLKESNSDNNEQKTFWFQEVAIDSEGKKEQIREITIKKQRIAISAVTLYSNYFEKAVRQLDQNASLKDCAYFNLNTAGGGATQSPVYVEMVKSKNFDSLFKPRFEKIVKYIKDKSGRNKIKLITFKGISDLLYSNYTVIKKKENVGLRYYGNEPEKAKQMDVFSIDVNGVKVKVYNILRHPSIGSKQPD